MNYSLTASYNVGIAQECGINAAILYNYLVFWSDKGSRNDGWIWKTAEDIEKDTALTRRQQELARKKLYEKEWVAEKLMKANGAATLHFKIKKGLTKVDSTKGENGIRQKGESYRFRQKGETHNSNKPVDNNSSSTSLTDYEEGDLTGQYKRAYTGVLKNIPLMQKEYPQIDNITEEVHKWAIWYQENNRSPGHTMTERMKRLTKWLDNYKPPKTAAPPKLTKKYKRY